MTADQPRRLAPKRVNSTVVLALAAVIAGSAVDLAAPAQADAAATVKARTQRMTASNLNAKQEGWYNPGDRITLVCSTRGQNVKGYFSFNIPGGWDNLWYRTSDGHYVADVDIETGTLNVVAPDCSTHNNPPAPAPAPAPSSKVDAAVAKANSMVGTDAYGPTGCAAFVAGAYGQAGTGYASALDFRNALAGQGKIHMDRNMPKGALVFSQSSYDIFNKKHYGHVVIARGDGKYVSGGVLPSYKGVAGTGHYVQVLPNWNPASGAEYLGWALPW